MAAGRLATVMVFPHRVAADLRYGQPPAGLVTKAPLRRSRIILLVPQVCSPRWWRQGRNGLFAVRMIRTFRVRRSFDQLQSCLVMVFVDSLPAPTRITTRPPRLRHLWKAVTQAG
jgi:hypothetical protein